MYCPHCGAQNPDDASRCLLCDQPLKQARPAEQQVPVQTPQVYPPPPVMQTSYGPPMSAAGMPPSILPWAIASTLCCCLPFGIVSIVYSAQISSKWNVGDAAGAWDSAQKAKMWAWIAFGVGLPLQILSFILNFAMAFAGEMG